jgi:hypothetical protein
MTVPAVGHPLGLPACASTLSSRVDSPPRTRGPSPRSASLETRDAECPAPRPNGDGRHGAVLMHDHAADLPHSAGYLQDVGGRGLLFALHGRGRIVDLHRSACFGLWAAIRICPEARAYRPLPSEDEIHDRLWVPRCGRVMDLPVFVSVYGRESGQDRLYDHPRVPRVISHPIATFDFGISRGERI